MRIQSPGSFGEKCQEAEEWKPEEHLSTKDFCPTFTKIFKTVNKTYQACLCDVRGIRDYLSHSVAICSLCIHVKPISFASFL